MFNTSSGVINLALQEEGLTGRVPAALGDLTALEQLVLSNNELSGRIPPELGRLMNLTQLWLHNNQLSGAIPAMLGNLTNLTQLWLHNNELNGAIPAVLGNLTNLKELWLNGNELNGAIPAVLGNLTNLKELWLNGNELSGSIPDLGSLTAMQDLHLECNDLAPTSTGLDWLTSLTSLDTQTAERGLKLHGNRISASDLPTSLTVTVSFDAPCVQVEPDDQRLTVTWRGPDEANDGSAITPYYYIVQYVKDGASDWVTEDAWQTGGGALEYTINGLENGKRYDVAMRAAFTVGGVPTWSSLSTIETGRPLARSRPPPPPQRKPTTTSTSSSSGGSSSRAPSPPPVPTRSPIIGSTPAATAMELAGDLLVLQRHDQPGVEVEVGVGWISRDGQRIITIGFVRDGDLGQTYAVVRREGDGQVVRRWIAPDSPLVYAVPWALVNTQYTFPVGVILALPLDDQYPPPNMLTRRFDGGDDRILAYDAGLGQWRHVPDLATFQALGFYWCNVTAADAGFFDRITLGPPYPATTVPARPDYPVLPDLAARHAAHWAPLHAPPPFPRERESPPLPVGEGRGEGRLTGVGTLLTRHPPAHGNPHTLSTWCRGAG